MTRSGASKLLSSPYFLGSSILFILFLSTKSWTQSSLIAELEKRIHILEKEIVDSETTLKETAEQLHSYRAKAEESKKAVIQKTQDCAKEAELLRKNLNDRTIALDNAESDLRRCQESAKTEEENQSSCRLRLSEVENTKEKLENDLNSCENAKNVKIQSLHERMTELESDLGKCLNRPVHIKNKPLPNSKKTLREGDLPDVSPDAVRVKLRDFQGMTYHKDESGNYLPLLPQSDPNAERARPRFSVANPPKNASQTLDKFRKGEVRLSEKDLQKGNAENGEEKGEGKMDEKLVLEKNLDAGEADNDVDSQNIEDEDQDPDGVLEKEPFPDRKKDEEDPILSEGDVKNSEKNNANAESTILREEEKRRNK